MKNIPEISKNKTKIAIYEDHGDNFAYKLTFHVIQFFGKGIDFVNSGEEKTSPDSDFIIFGIENHEKFPDLHPNVLAICKNLENKDSLKKILQNITSGGMLIFNENDWDISKISEAANNYFKKIGFKTPEFQTKENQIFLKTDLGEIPLDTPLENLPKIDATRLLCQQIGIQEEDFFEALLHFQL